MRFKLACSATETSQNKEISLVGSLDVIFSNKRITKVLSRLRGCAVLSAPVLFANTEDRFYRVEAYLSPYIC